MPTIEAEARAMDKENAGHSVLLVYSDEQSQHVLSETHPMRPVRLAHMYDLMTKSDLLDAPNLSEREPSEASAEDILRLHDSEYVEVVRAIDRGAIVPNMWQFGFGPGDNPPRRGIYRHAALAVGGVIDACQAVLTQGYATAFVPAAGMHHHAMHNRAAGFGIFNDCAIAILDLIERGLRVLYIDIDVHHGDGVQAALYNTDRALTLSLHESGIWLFPGTGAPDEIGTGQGKGYSVNVPLAPGTNDADWHRAFDAIVPPIFDAFNPDFLITQLGIDTHRDDPLAHLRLTTQGHNLAVRKFAEFATARRCPWVAVGGGGYDFAAVARAWTMDLATMARFDLPHKVPMSYDAIPGLTTFEDATTDQDIAGPDGVADYNDAAMDEARRLTFNIIGA